MRTGQTQGAPSPARLRLKIIGKSREQSSFFVIHHIVLRAVVSSMVSRPQPHVLVALVLRLSVVWRILGRCRNPLGFVYWRGQEHLGWIARIHKPVRHQCQITECIIVTRTFVRQQFHKLLHTLTSHRAITRNLVQDLEELGSRFGQHLSRVWRWRGSCRNAAAVHPLLRVSDILQEVEVERQERPHPTLFEVDRKIVRRKGT